MPEDATYEIILYYSHLNRESFKTRIAIHEFFMRNHLHQNIKIEEVNYDLMNNNRYQDHVKGIPALLIIKNQKILTKHYGEISKEEFANLLKRTLEK